MKQHDNIPQQLLIILSQKICYQKMQQPIPPPQQPTKQFPEAHPSAPQKIPMDPSSQPKALPNHKNSDKQSNNLSFSEKSQKKHISQKSPSKKINLLTKTNDERRKLSGQYHGNKDKNDNNLQLYHKSDRAQINSSSQNGNVLIDQLQKKSKGYNYQISQIQGSYWKKIRNLQTRLKNINLNYNTLIIKLKNDNNKLDKQNKFYQKYIDQHYPNQLDHIHKSIQQYIKQQQQAFYQSNSNSSQEEKHDQWMPIMSKMQQIRIDLTKVFQTVKGYQTVIKKYEQQKQQARKKQLQQQTNLTNWKTPLSTQKKLALRKFSIPVNLLKTNNESSKKILQVQNQHSIQFQQPKNKKQQLFTLEDDVIQFAQQLNKL